MTDIAGLTSLCTDAQTKARLEEAAAMSLAPSEFSACSGSLLESPGRDGASVLSQALPSERRRYPKTWCPGWPKPQSAGG